jgi:hypothetical protein
VRSAGHTPQSPSLGRLHFAAGLRYFDAGSDDGRSNAIGNDSW